MTEYRLITIGVNDPKNHLEVVMTEMSKEGWEVVSIDNQSYPRAATMKKEIKKNGK